MLVFLAACGGNDDADDPVEDVTDELEEGVEEGIDDAEDMIENQGNDMDDDDDATTSTDGADQADMEAQLENLNFHDIEIEISYGEDREFELSLDRDDDDNRIDAEIEDEINNVFFEGRDAFEHIFPKLESLELSSDSAEEEVIEQVLNAFDLPNDYDKFEIEVYFNDGKRIDFEHRK